MVGLSHFVIVLSSVAQDEFVENGDFFLLRFHFKEITIYLNFLSKHEHFDGFHPSYVRLRDLIQQEKMRKVAECDSVNFFSEKHVIRLDFLLER